MGIRSGTSVFRSSITTNPASIFPKSRIHSDRGRITTSRIMIGATTGTGLAKCFTQCFSPFFRIPENSIRHILMIASAAVTFRSFVGGLNPSSAMVLDTPRKRSTVIRYGIYLLFSYPIIPSKKSLAQLMADSSASCTFPGFSTFRLRTRSMDASTRTAIIIHVTTTDSEIPPRTGRVKTVSQFSSSISVSVRFPVSLPPFFFRFNRYYTEGFFVFLHKKSERAVLPRTRCIIPLFRLFFVLFF